MHPYIPVPLPWGGTFRLASYGTSILVGFLLCLWLIQRRGRRMGIDPAALFDTATVVLLLGLVGARIFYVVDYWDDFSAQPLHVFYFWKGGLSFFGGLIGGTLTLLVCIRVKRLPLRPTLDVAAGLLPLGHAFGRIGCFLNGCCYGELTSSWIGLRFPRVMDAEGDIIGCPVFLDHLHRGLVTAADGRSLAVLPTQLYAAAYNFVIFAVLSWFLWRRRRAGEVAWLYLVLYGLARGTNEFFRGDTEPVAALGGMTIFQAIAATALAFGLAMFVRSRLLPAEPLPEPPPTAPLTQQQSTTKLARRPSGGDTKNTKAKKRRQKRH